MLLSSVSRKDVLRSQSQRALQANPTMDALPKARKYGILRIHLGFSNFRLTLTTLEGQVVQWLNGGSDVTHSKRTRMTSRSVSTYLKTFLSNLPAGLSRHGICYLKVLFLGPSKRFRGKLYSSVKKRSHSLGVQVLCQEEGFRRSFGGCRLARAKR